MSTVLVVLWKLAVFWTKYNSKNAIISNMSWRNYAVGAKLNKVFHIQNTHSRDIYKTALYCSKVTCDLLKFSFKQDVLFKNKVSKAHCVTYAKLHATLCNIAYNAHNIDAMATPVVGYAVLNFININKLCTALVPPKYERYFIDHDAVEIRCKSSGETLWIIDPTERDYIIWGGIYKKSR